MYANVWTKYLPVIRIVLKKSLAAEQVLQLNIPDFERAGLSRKSGYKFMIKIMNGKVDNVIIDSPVASSLASVLLQDPAVKPLLLEQEFHISLNPKFELTIKHVPHAVEKEAEVDSNEAQ
jgi:hypothetical protein